MAFAIFAFIIGLALGTFLGAMLADWAIGKHHDDLANFGKAEGGDNV